MNSMSQPKITFERVPVATYPEWGFRSGTPMVPTDMNFIFINGGMGDYICWMPAIQWLASQAKWIRGKLVHPVYFGELAEYWLKPYADWAHQNYEDIRGDIKADNTPFRGPVELQRESLNATGAHLMTCGWVYFTNKEKAPPGWEHYSRIDQEHLDGVLTAKQFNLPEKYAVITTGVTTNSRKVKPAYWNMIIEYVVSKGLTPVFLGKSVTQTGNARNIHTEWGAGTRFDLGMDLRDKTSLMEAAAVMSRAQLVVGHDNGLLHLAACTEVPIVFGYNLASPEHRQPSRASGRIYNVHLQPGELACNFCQSHTNFVIGYNFRECFYSDMKCIDLLFANGAEYWRKQIDAALASHAIPTQTKSA